MTDETITPATDLPDWDGRPVPWITRWTGEIAPDRNNYGIDVNGDPRSGEFRVGYQDGKNNRDASGMLWQREGLGRHGIPEWAAVSTYRQRAAMRKCLCQVCGKSAKGAPIFFLIPDDSGMEEVEDGVFITMQAPVCAPCIPLALKLCPALKRDGYRLLRAIDYEPWGIFGQVTYMAKDGGFRKVQTAVEFTGDYGPQFRLSHVMAQQLVVKLGKFVVAEHHEGNRPVGKVSAFAEFLDYSGQQQKVMQAAGEVSNEYAQDLKPEAE